MWQGDDGAGGQTLNGRLVQPVLHKAQVRVVTNQQPETMETREQSQWYNTAEEWVAVFRREDKKKPIVTVPIDAL